LEFDWVFYLIMIYWQKSYCQVSNSRKIIPHVSPSSTDFMGVFLLLAVYRKLKCGARDVVADMAKMPKCVVKLYVHWPQTALRSPPEMATTWDAFGHHSAAFWPFRCAFHFISFDFFFFFFIIIVCFSAKLFAPTKCGWQHPQQHYRQIATDASQNEDVGVAGKPNFWLPQQNLVLFTIYFKCSE